VRTQAGAPQYNAFVGTFADTVNLQRDGLLETFDPADFPSGANTLPGYRLTTQDGRLLGVPVYFQYYCGIEMLVGQIESLWISMGPILKVYHEDITTDYLEADEHAHLVEALRKQDGPAARQALERDLVRGGEGILNFIVNRPKTKSQEVRRRTNGRRQAA
jgi:hypothetical protein